MIETGAPLKGAPVLAFFAALVAASFIAVFGIAVARSPEKLAVLVYHHIEEPATSEVSCTPAQFSAQMAALLANGFTPLGLEHVRLFLSGGLQQVKNPVLITFDDGYESLYQYALPVAKKLNIPMTVFVVTSRIGLKPQFARYLSGKQIREMSRAGCFEFG
ncbi:MAG TPA: polysaccharide deacetylase family protein, partial [Candidatus Ozemobacteraceae bacterium]|nr:polysaccharide deacetylase family protein [Candidatus Ozemobacteraceae bacterium]